jgi:hypothetical protein
MVWSSLHRKLLVMTGSLALLWLIVGCAAAPGSSATRLLDQDFRNMSNAELTAYEQALSDEIARGTGGGWGGTSIGFGIGSWGSDTGVGIGVNQNVGGGGDGYASVELRDRREAVRVEMRRRGLLPPTAAP